MKLSVQEFNKYKKNLKLEPYEKFAQDFLKKHFNLDLEIPLKLNGHLKRAVGRFIARNKTPLYIELGTEFFAGNELVNKMEDNYKILGHELVHYAFLLQGKDNRDGSYEFEKKLIELSLPSSMAVYGRTENSYLIFETPISKVSVWLNEDETKELISKKHHKTGKFYLEDSNKIKYRKIKETYYESN